MLVFQYADDVRRTVSAEYEPSLFLGVEGGVGGIQEDPFRGTGYSAAPRLVLIGHAGQGAFYFIGHGGSSFRLETLHDIDRLVGIVGALFVEGDARFGQRVLSGRV
jgi:hypothetical protein